MIDLSFAKIAIIGFVALLILGPEKLPHAARVAGSLLGRMQRYINNVKSEVAQDMALDELRKAHADVGNLGKSVAKEFSEAANDVGQKIKASRDNMMSKDKLVGPMLVSPENNTHQRNTKRRSFRQHRLEHASSIPNWYKKQCRSGKRASPAVSSIFRRKSHRTSGGIPLYL